MSVQTQSSILSLAKQAVKRTNPKYLDGLVVWQSENYPNYFSLKVDNNKIYLVWNKGGEAPISSGALFSKRSRVQAPTGWRGASRRVGSGFTDVPLTQARYDFFCKKIIKGKKKNANA